MPPGEDELEGLSPEEIAAMKEDDEPEVDPPSEPHAEDPPDPDPPEDPPAKDEPPDKPPVKPPEEEPPAEPPPEVITPQMSPLRMSGVKKEDLDAAKAELEEAQKKFDDGEIPMPELLAATRKVDRLEIEADVTAKVTEASRQSLWEDAQARFYAANEKFQDNPALNMLMVSRINAQIKDGKDSEFASDAEFLHDCKKWVDEQLGLVVPAKADDPEAAKRKALANAKKTAADRSRAPADIGGLPSAQENIEPGKWDHLDRLAETDPEKYQEAIDKMSDAQIQEYEDTH